MILQYLAWTSFPLDSGHFKNPLHPVLFAVQLPTIECRTDFARLH